MDSSLEENIASLPQELQDQVLHTLLRLHLVVGRIELTATGHVTARQSDHNPHSRPNARILYALDRKRYQWARKSMYSNTFVIPIQIFDPEFYKLWDLATLKSLPRIELRLNTHDFWSSSFWPIPARQIHLFTSDHPSAPYSPGQPISPLRIWSQISWIMNDARTDRWSISNVRCKRDVENKNRHLDFTLAPREALRQEGVFGPLTDDPDAEPSQAQVVTLNQEDMQRIVDEIPSWWCSILKEYFQRLAGKLHMAIRITNMVPRDRSAFRIYFQVEGISRSVEEMREVLRLAEGM